MSSPASPYRTTQKWDECLPAKANWYRCADATPDKGGNGQVIMMYGIIEKGGRLPHVCNASMFMASLATDKRRFFINSRASKVAQFYVKTVIDEDIVTGDVAV
ncbi:hypothetical protein VC83_05949 [Pseudogymnoascus destructans]|uniref:Uncharacterized protein n=1 Tax=Pseudogymnoascus destructans TaxID=655981 RepID=A0A177A5Y0_9PEZI|nr:uncharacterized protein VC83_05949 [Pseudogymnoascus destructans]OAF57030.1 hypothetical protein VC83_05949 [Pseudogymnoascus destructans]